MDILLAIDCSLRWTNAAVISGDIRGARNADIGRGQAAELPAIVDEVLRSAGVRNNEITHVGVTIGPGYFTGVRIGMSFAAAFAFGVGAKIVPIGTLDALMFGQNPESVCLVYAGKGKIYSASGAIKTAEYTTDKILELTDEKINFFSDNPEKNENFPRKVEKILPRAENAALLSWQNRHSAILPHELRADWCKSPV